ncbi:hypothetical protein SME38J_24070 [Serratia marcescens]|nr:hypothetical protein SME38J_24070 [Serratia marcescens]
MTSTTILRIAPEYDAFTHDNKINAYRSGFAAEYVDLATLRRSSLTAHILHTLEALNGFAERQKDRAVLQRSSAMSARASAIRGISARYCTTACRRLR